MKAFLHGVQNSKSMPGFPLVSVWLMFFICERLSWLDPDSSLALLTGEKKHEGDVSLKTTWALTISVQISHVCSGAVWENDR